MAGCRYGADILGDLARLSLTDPDAGEPDPVASPEVPFEAIVVKQHKWQVHGTPYHIRSACPCRWY